MSINKEVFNYLLPLKPSQVKGFYYLENNNDAKAPYATLFQIDDPRELNFFCSNQSGQTRFQLDVFDWDYTTGIETREEYITIVEAMKAITLNGYEIWDSRVLNVTDRSNSINNLFQFSTEFIVSWEK